MPNPTIKELAKFYNEEILKDTSLSLDNVIEVSAQKAEIAPETVKDALQGKAKLTNEVLAKIFEALGISIEAEHPEDEDCPGGASRLPNGDCPPPQGEPQGNGQNEGKNAKSTVSEQLEGTFGKDDLGNHFNEVLTIIKANKDTETAKYLSEVMRKVFETIPAIIKAEQGDKIAEYTKKVDELTKKQEKKDKEIEELQSAMKKVPKLTEALNAVGKSGHTGKGLFEQGEKKDKRHGTIEEMSMGELEGAVKSLPKFD